MRLFLKKSLLRLSFLALSLSILLSIEVFSTHFVTKKRLDQIIEVLQEDQLLIWRQRPNFNQVFQGKLVTTDEAGFRIVSNSQSWDKSKIKLAVMGPSPCFGFGVDNEHNYSHLLQELFNTHSISGSVFNASQIGYSSYQGKLLFEHVVKNKKPTHIIISYVVNDLDHYRFFNQSALEDKKVIPRNKLIIYIENNFRRLNLYNIIKNQIFQISSNKKTAGIHKARVSIEDYEKNIQDIINSAVKNDIKVLLMKFPLTLPNNSETEFMNKNIIDYNSIITKLSKINKLELIDIVSAFSNTKEYMFIDRKFDTFHPNEKGHLVIANEIYRSLLK